MSKILLNLVVVVTLLLAGFIPVDKVQALSGCGSSYTVQWGDTLSGIAVKCGTTMSALWLANPGLGSWVYAGQVLAMPGASWVGSTGATVYIVTHGDTLKTIAARYGVSLEALASQNGIYNYNLIYAGQRLTIPTGIYVPPVPPAPPAPPPSYGSTYIVQRGDTLRQLAYRWGMSIHDIMIANPQITNASVIYAGQVIYIPGVVVAPVPGYHTVVAGDTLKKIADYYGTTIYNLQLLNPQIWNPNWIYVGMTIRVK